MSQKKKAPLGRPRGPKKLAVTGLVLESTHRAIFRRAKLEKTTIGGLLEEVFGEKTKNLSVS